MIAHPTEFRTLSDYHLQRDLERRLAARKAAEIEREAKLRKLPTPQQPEPVNFCAGDDDVPPAVTRRQLLVIAVVWCGAMAFSCWLAGWI